MTTQVFIYQGIFFARRKMLLEVFDTFVMKNLEELRSEIRIGKSKQIVFTTVILYNISQKDDIEISHLNKTFCL